MSNFTRWLFLAFMMGPLLLSAEGSPICFFDWVGRDALVVTPPEDISHWQTTPSRVEPHFVVQRVEASPRQANKAPPEGLVLRWTPFDRGRPRNLPLDSTLNDLRRQFPNAQLNVLEHSGNHLYAEVKDPWGSRAAVFGFQKANRGWFQMMYYQQGDTSPTRSKSWLTAFRQAYVHNTEFSDRVNGGLPCPAYTRPKAIRSPNSSTNSN